MIALCAILLFAPEARSQVTVKKKMFTISGKTGLSDVTLQVSPGSTTVQTDQDGAYSVEVEYGWTGKITPVKTGYKFDPAYRDYSTRVTANKADQDYTAERVKFIISGSTTLPGVILRGFDTDVVSSATGTYSVTVEYGWTGTIVPEKAGYRFEPPSHAYPEVTSSSKDDYKPIELTFTISGSVGKAGIPMKIVPSTAAEVVSGADGAYRIEVPYNWSGTITPTKDGHLFTPPNYEYAALVEDRLNQDFSVQVLYYPISGSVGQAGVAMSGLPGDVVSDENGYYSASVEHGWFGKVTPEKPGWEFAPPSVDYKPVKEAHEAENYTATEIFLTISGTTGISQVTLAGFPSGPLTTDERGAYTTKVPYNWSNTITPQKDGYYFEPSELSFAPGVTADKVKQDFKAQKIYFEIAGNAKLPGVSLKATPGSISTVSKADGSYSMRVEWSWKGKVTPTKSGFMFEPAERDYPGVTTPQMDQDYIAMTIRHPISGKIVDKKGSPVADVLIVAEGTPPVEPVMTNSDGAFEIKVEHNWRGRITAKLDGWNFSPSMKSFDASPVTGPTTVPTITGEIKMMTLSGIVKYDEKTPIVGVRVTADPNDGTVSSLTDATGRYNVKVPYHWSGSLSFFKEEFEIDANYSYADVTQDIDESAPKKTVSPAPEPVRPSPGPDRPQGAQPVSDGQGTAMAATEVLMRKLAEIRKEQDDLTKLPPSAPNNERMLELVRQEAYYTQLIEGRGGDTRRIVDSNQVPSPTPPKGRDVLTPKLHSTLGELARRTNTKIYVDMTVKDEPTAVGVDSVTGQSVEQALQQILDGTEKKKYTFRAEPDNTYLVYYPLSNMYTADTLITNALGDITSETGVPIICDPNVQLTTTASFDEVPLEMALDMILAGTPYSFKRMQNYYLVGDSGPGSMSFHRLMETRHMRLSNITPQRVRDLLPQQHKQYVQAEAASTTDPNDQGHWVTVAAPAGIADTIMGIIKGYDVCRRQVLLDARVVAMENTNDLNLGIKWDFPTFRYGQVLSASDWTKVFSIGYTADEGFTNALMAQLNALEADNKLEIMANPQLAALDGSQAELRSVREEWYMMTSASETLYADSELQKIESGTILTITPHIGDGNDITLEFAVEISDSIARGAVSDLPIINRRQAKSRVTIQNGGTAALAGLTENRTRTVNSRVPGLGGIPVIGRLFRNDDDQKSKREIAVFVTANLVPEEAQTAVRRPQGSETLAVGSQARPAGAEFKNDLAKALANQP